MKTKAVIYDMDGVLIDSEPLWIQSEIEIFGELGIPLTHKMCTQHMGLRTSEVVELWYDQKPWKGKSKEEVTENILDKVNDLILKNGTAMKGVKSSLDHFKSLGLRLALASSSPKRLIETILKKLELGDIFEVTNSAEGLKYGKPHPEIFLRTAEDLSLKPVDCLVIEDSYNGIIAAKASRMKVIAVPDQFHKNDKRFVIADYILNDLTEVENIKIE